MVLYNRGSTGCSLWCIVSLCWRCGEEPGSPAHLLILSPFASLLDQGSPHCSEIGGLPWTPVFFLIHHDEIPSKTYRKSILPLLFTAAKSCIPLCWKQTQPQSVAIWMKKVSEMHFQEKGKKKVFYWHKFIYSEDHAELVT